MNLKNINQTIEFLAASKAYKAISYLLQALKRGPLIVR